MIEQFFSFFLRIVLIAAFVPHIDLLISLVGSLLGSALAFIFPAAIHTAAFWSELVRGESEREHLSLNNSLNSERFRLAASSAAADASCAADARSPESVVAVVKHSKMQRTLDYLLLARNAFIALVGLLGFVAGTYCAGRDIIVALREDW